MSVLIEWWCMFLGVFQELFVRDRKEVLFEWESVFYCVNGS